MSKPVHADPSVGSCEHGCHADTYRVGDDWREGSVSHRAAGPALRWCDEGSGDDRVYPAWTGHEHAGHYDVQANGRSARHHNRERASIRVTIPTVIPAAMRAASAAASRS
jgi:hypothetical protein